MKRTNNKAAKTDHGAHDAAVAECIAELLRNPRTPQSLFEAIGQWICDASTEASLNVLHTQPVITMLLSDIPDSERHGSKTD